MDNPQVPPDPQVSSVEASTEHLQEAATDPVKLEIGIDEATQADEFASGMFYTLIPRNDSVQVDGFAAITDAERFKQSRPSPDDVLLISHSRRTFKRMKMEWLLRIVRAGRPDINAAQLPRKDLAGVAFDSLWAACVATGGVHKSTEDKKVASTTIGRTRGVKVREMRDGRKGAKATNRAPAGTKSRHTAPTNGARKPTAPRVAAADAYAGKKIHLVGDKDTNPRREGTHGHKSLQIIVKNPGITYEEYLKKGGRRVDLKGSLEMKPAQVRLS